MKVKVISVMGCFMLLLVSTHCFALGDDVATAAIKEVGETARHLINKDKSEVKIQDSNFTNDVDLQEAISVGVSGIEVTGDKVEVTGSDFDNKVKMREAISVGTSGIKVGK